MSSSIFNINIICYIQFPNKSLLYNLPHLLSFSSSTCSPSRISSPYYYPPILSLQSLTFPPSRPYLPSLSSFTLPYPLLCYSDLFDPLCFYPILSYLIITFLTSFTLSTSLFYLYLLSYSPLFLYFSLLLFSPAFPLLT